MSKGPGKWQKLILEAVTKKGGQIYLIDLLPPSFTESQYQAAYRAAATLAKSKEIAIMIYRFGSPRIMIGPPGCTFNR